MELKKELEPLPEELIKTFEVDEVYKNAFNSLTLGRQRGYIINFSQPKNAETRIRRIAKARENILLGIGLNDKFKI